MRNLTLSLFIAALCAIGAEPDKIVQQSKGPCSTNVANVKGDVNINGCEPAEAPPAAGKPVPAAKVSAETDPTEAERDDLRTEGMKASVAENRYHRQKAGIEAEVQKAQAELNKTQQDALSAVTQHENHKTAVLKAHHAEGCTFTDDYRIECKKPDLPAAK